uniref:Reverse transcriptase zinc-binding domain-containing protein n=1 Tax=Manihot esculenta TaxID=3983 RepID=A0A2C9VBH5_MANES
MQIVVLPVLDYKEMEKICRDFLWHGRSEARKIHLINWDIVIKSKKLGGLDSNQLIWKLIWKVRETERMRVFLWEVAHGKIMSNVERKMRTFTNIDTCGLCLSSAEMIFHALRDCSFTKQVWDKFEASQLNEDFYRVLIQTDCLVAMDIIFGRGQDAFCVVNLVKNITEILKREWDIKVVKVFREANRIANCFAAKFSAIDYGIIWLNTPDSDVKWLLDADVLGVYWPRLTL